MAFEIVFTQFVVEVRYRLCPKRDAIVVCVVGDTTDSTSIWTNWGETPAAHVDVCIPVRTMHLKQVKYGHGILDAPHAHHDDLTGS